MGDTVHINGAENNGILAIWMTLQLVEAQQRDVGNQLHRVVPGRQKGLVFDVWALITSFAIGDNNRDIFSPLDTVGNYALCLKDRPITRRPITHGIFPIVFHPDVLVQAVLHGDETMVRHILKANPDLTQVGEGMDFSGREFTREKGTALTAIQAAIACGDFAPNQNSTGLCELLIEALKQQRPNDWQQITHDQTLALYTQSLRFYAKKQSEKICTLYERVGNGEKIDTTVIRAAEKRLEAYDRALHSKDLAAIIHAHTHPNPDLTQDGTSDAQKDHVIPADQVLIDAIAAATDDEIQAVLNDPTIDSPLSNLIKQYRKEVDTICQSEIIANPQHLLRLFVRYDAFYTRVMNADPNYKQRELFWCHLVGYVQRYLPACGAQIFANPVLYRAAEKAHTSARSFDFKSRSFDFKSRSFDFKYGGGSIFPISFDSNSGLGYKFAGSWGRCVRNRGQDSPLQNLCRAKTANFQNLLHSLCEHAPASLSVSTSV